MAFRDASSDGHVLADLLGKFFASGPVNVNNYSIKQIFRSVAIFSNSNFGVNKLLTKFLSLNKNWR